MSWRHGASSTGRQHTTACARGFHAHFKRTSWVVYPVADEGRLKGWNTMYFDYLSLCDDGLVSVPAPLTDVC